jgi:hypothetical protein
VLAAGAAVVVPTLAFLLAGAAGVLDATPSPDPPIGVALSHADRAALGAVPVERGAPPAPVDPTVDLTDAGAVARAYLAAAHSVEPDDAGRTQLRAAGYAVPGSSASAVGVVVLDPPPAGSLRTATVTALELVAADASGTRRGYRAEVGTATGPPGGALAIDLVTSRIVLARQADGRWLVAAETPDLPTGEDQLMRQPSEEHPT